MGEPGGSESSVPGNEERMLEPLVALAVAASGTLLFAHGGALMTADADGNAVHELPVRGDSPRWSPDGTKILYTRPGSSTPPSGTLFGGLLGSSIP
jgi:hypothetical protein